MSGLYALQWKKLYRRADQKGKGNVPEKDSLTPDLNQDPIEDTPGEDTPDTSENTQAAPDDETAKRYRALEAAFHGRFPDEDIPVPTGDSKADYKVLQGRWTKLNQQPVTEPESPQAKEDWKARYEAESWKTARMVYGNEIDDAVAAYNAAIERDPTPFGAITALEVYVAKRMEQTQTTAPATAPTRQEAVRPRVDSNRSDASPALAISLEEARKQGGEAGLMAWIRSQREAATNR